MKAAIRFALATTTALGWMTPALAQQAQGGAGSDNDIVVTARRVEERLQDVPISITVLNQQQLANRNVTNAQDLAISTPSLSATTSFGAENSTFAIRGFVQETGTGPSVGVYFADVVAPRGASQGFPAGDGAGPGSFFDLQNVQVLKGPQGTLFGRNTTGGAILLVPNKPTDRLEGYVEGSLGNYDMKRVQAVLNLPIADTVRLRLGVDRQKRDGYMINDSGIGPKDFDDVNYIAARASLIVDLTPDIENYTVASYTKSDNNGHVQKLIACNPSTNPANFLGLLGCGQLARIPGGQGFYHLNSDMPDAYSKLRQWQVVNTTTWTVNDSLTVKNIVSYARLKTKIHSDLFGTNFIIPAGAFAAPIPGVFPGFPATNTALGFAVIRNIPGGYSSNENTFTDEFRLQGTGLDSKLSWQAGAYYENATPNGFIGSQSPVVIGCSDPDKLICTDLLGAGVVNYTVAKNSSRTIGLYGQATYDLTSQLKLTGGFRYTWDRVGSTSRGISYFFPVGVPNASPGATACTLPSDPTLPASALPTCEYARIAKFSAPTWLIDLDYKPTDDIMLYAKYSRGYRTGGLKSDVPIQYIVFQPEKVDTFEVGAKSSFEGFIRGTFNIAGFYNKFSNQQIQFGFNANPCYTTVNGVCQPAPITPTAGPVNVGKSRIWGIEVDTRLHLFQGFVLDGGYTYLNTKVTQVITPTLPANSLYVPNGFVRVGDSLVLSPKHKLSISGTYTLPIPEGLGELSVGATYVYTSSQISNYSNRLYTGFLFNGVTAGPATDLGILGPRNLVNANITWTSAAGGPIDLSFFVTNLTKEKYYTAVPGLIGSIGSEAATIGEPRMFGFRAKFNFGAK
jgi:iron complex outermembrane receptor protein